MDDNIIIPYIEPIFRFCCKRLSNRYDAEDLASEIICYILDGMKKYKIESLNAWIWQIAHNRYARFLDTQSKMQIILAEDEALFNVVKEVFAPENYNFTIGIPQGSNNGVVEKASLTDENIAVLIQNNLVVKSEDE